MAGTSSDAGKSLVVTGLCRVARRRGVKVAPFKAQNMSNNSMVVADGEIGRAQWLQAIGAGITPSTILNPVLLKPGSDRQSFVVLRGQPAGQLRSGEYATGRAHLREAAWEAFEELRSEYELVICEGAGSPAEINLREGDYTNMGLARQFDLPVVLVGDIDRGGVLASIFGTHGLLDDDDRALLAGYIINKFRGDQSILDPGLTTLTDRTGMKNFGVLPWLPGMWIDREDTLQVGQFGPPEPMSGHHIQDSLETGDDADGLGLLPFETRFHPEKMLTTPSGTWRGHEVSGYEIHHGRPHRIDGEAEDFPGGLRRGNVWASMWHGTMEYDGFRRAWLTEAATQAGSSWQPRESEGFGAAREALINAIADAIEEHLDVEDLLNLRY